MTITTVHDRFQVGCECCSFVSGHLTRDEAIGAAKRHKAKHTEAHPPEWVSVYDIMAHANAEREWFV